jgi:hypothetical protein
MTRRRHTKLLNTRQSITGAGLVYPNCWQISHTEAAEALEMPVERIVKIVPRRYQICIVYLNEAGQKCSSFFSYRRFSRYQQEVQEAICSCKNLQSLEFLAEIIQYDLCHFRYHRVEIADALWDTLLQRLAELRAASRYATASV